MHFIDFSKGKLTFTKPFQTNPPQTLFLPNYFYKLPNMPI